MKFLEEYKKFSLYILDKETAEKYKNEILSLLQLIPKSDYKIYDIVREKKEERVFYGKWKHSLILFDKDKVIGVLIAYEREKEENNLYSENSFYINETAVHKDYQGYGIGKYLIGYFLENTKDFICLSGEKIFKIQTEDSIENIKVINFYKSFGFSETGKKKYPEKYDLVMELKKGYWCE